ncbi:hypothetical protein Nmel_011254, partial [Mimus melanotis]
MMAGTFTKRTRLKKKNICSRFYKQNREFLGGSRVSCASASGLAVALQPRAQEPRVPGNVPACGTGRAGDRGASRSSRTPPLAAVGQLSTGINNSKGLMKCSGTRSS